MTTLGLAAALTGLPGLGISQKACRKENQLTPLPVLHKGRQPQGRRPISSAGFLNPPFALPRGKDIEVDEQKRMNCKDRKELKDKGFVGMALMMQINSDGVRKGDLKC